MKTLDETFAPSPSPRPLRGRRGGAFTLIELLVVIVAIAVLVSLLGPVISGATNSAKMAKSLANLKVMSGGLSLYVADHDGRLPESSAYATCPILPSASSPSSYLYWFDALAFYIEGARYIADRRDRLAQRPAWQTCPARPLVPPQVHASRNQGISVGYGWNYKFFGYDASNSSGTSGYQSRMVDVSLPGQTIVIGTNSEENTAGVRIAADSGQNANIYPEARLSRRFRGAGLYLFLDGHVSRLTPEEAKENNDYFFKKTK